MNSIRRRLLFWLLLPLTAVAVIVSFETFFSARDISNDLHDRTLLAGMLTVSENVVASNGTLLAENTLEVLTDNLGDEFFYHVLGPNGAFVTGYSRYPRLPDDIQLKDGEPAFYDGTYQDSPVRVVALRQLLVGRELNGWTTITTWQKTTKRSELTIDLFSRSLIRLAALVIAAGLIVWFAVKYGLTPLRELQQAIETRTPYDLTPIRRRLPIELTGIVSSMNALFGRVERSKANRERFIADAAHQLRNPIAALKVQAEVALVAETEKKSNQGLNQIVKVSNQTSQLVEKMLTNARAHVIDRETFESFDLSETILDAARSFAPMAIDKNQEFSSDVMPNILFKGDRVLMKEAILNLLENASKYNNEGSEIRLEMVADEQSIKIGVIDDGSEITEKDFFRLCQPFYTNDAANSGNGLGLAIAWDVAKNHGGELSTYTAQGRNGKVIQLTLPTVD